MFSLMNDTATAALIVLASLNMIAFVSLVGEAASGYLHKAETDAAGGKTGYVGAKLRLQMVRVLLWATSVIAALKITLPGDLADGIISAWFVGQGFALQNVTRSIIAGLVARYSDDLHGALVAGRGTVKVDYKDMKGATVKSCNLATFSLQMEKKVIVLEWTAVHDLTIHTS